MVAEGVCTTQNAAFFKTVSKKKTDAPQVINPAAGDKFLELRRHDQQRALQRIADDPELSRLQLIKAPLLDLEVRGAAALNYFGSIAWRE